MKTYNKLPLPTEPQARLIAAQWAADEPIHVGGFETPTIQACLRKGWFETTQETGHYPNGAPWMGYKVSKLGRLALENFLMHRRLDEVTVK